MSMEFDYYYVYTFFADFLVIFVTINSPYSDFYKFSSMFHTYSSEISVTSCGGRLWAEDKYKKYNFYCYILKLEIIINL